MVKYLVTLLTLIPALSFAQSAEDDEITFQAAIDWLDRKLNYIYFDDVAQKWWLNKFYINDKKEVTVKNIFTDKPRSANIKEKVYLIRTFQLEDINPYQMSIVDIETNQGRIAKGKLLELHTFEHKNSIRKTIDGRRASNTSFVQISFPTILTDSIPEYADIVRSKLAEAIIASTKIYKVPGLEENKEKIFEILDGRFQTDGGEKLEATKRFENVVKMNFGDETEDFFGFDNSTNTFFVTTISLGSTRTNTYTLLPGNKLSLQNTEKKSDLIEFETVNSVRINGKVYYRE